jgi:hypothetical protein
MGLLFLKILGWWALSIVKFLIVPFLMMASRSEDWSWLETLIITSSGAAGGVFVFFHTGEYIFNFWAKLTGNRGKKKKVMTRSRRMIVRLKWNYGIKGLMLISALISVPVASLLAAKFYRHQPNSLPLMIIGFFLWSLVLTSIAYFTKISL